MCCGCPSTSPERNSTRHDAALVGPGAARHLRPSGTVRLCPVRCGTSRPRSAGFGRPASGFESPGEQATPTSYRLEESLALLPSPLEYPVFRPAFSAPIFLFVVAGLAPRLAWADPPLPNRCDGKGSSCYVNDPQVGIYVGTCREATCHEHVADPHVDGGLITTYHACLLCLEGPAPLDDVDAATPDAAIPTVDASAPLSDTTTSDETSTTVEAETGSSLESSSQASETTDLSASSLQPTAATQDESTATTAAPTGSPSSDEARPTTGTEARTSEAPGCTCRIQGKTASSGSAYLTVLVAALVGRRRIREANRLGRGAPRVALP